MRPYVVLALAVILSASATGCTYFRNRLDDFCDIVTVGVGGTIADKTPFPPALGVYVEATEILHLGGMVYQGYMAEVDRRGASITLVKEDTRWGIGPFHRWYRDEVCVHGNWYKNGDMFTWEQRMMEKAIRAPALAGPVDPKSVRVPAKRMRFEDLRLGPFPRGYQDWGYVGLDVAICEPFLLHAGIRTKVGVDFSQISDFIMGIFTLDMYGDDASEMEYNGFYDSRAAAK